MGALSIRRSEAGFTVIEVLVAALVFSLSSFAAFGVVRQLAANSSHAVDASTDDGTIDRLTSELSSDSATALAVYNPADDDCSGVSGTALSLYYKDNGGASESIKYAGDASGAVTRINSSGGATSTFSHATLSVQCVNATALVARENLEPDLPGVTVHDYPVNFRADAAGAQQTGGNRVIIVRISSTKTAAARELHLMAGSVPTGFTIIGPQWHAVVYREDHTRRFLFGLGQTSWLRIMAEVDVSYDDWRTRAVWCNFEALEVYGGQPRFNKDDVPVYLGATDMDAPTRIAVPDLYPETLLEYCRKHFSPDPPGSLAGMWVAPGPLPTPDDQVVTIPPWWVWQNCGPSMQCPAGMQPPATCDPNVPGSCTVTAPDIPPPGWPAWCAQWSPPDWGAPYFGPPCPAATPPPPPPTAPPPPPPPPAGTSVSASISTSDSYGGSIDPFNSFSSWSAGIGSPSGSVVASDGGTGSSGDAGFADPGASASGPSLGYVIIGQFTTNTGTVNVATGAFGVSGNGDVTINVDIFPVDHPPSSQAGLCNGACTLNGTLVLPSPGTYYVAAVADLYGIAGLSGCQQCAGGGNNTFSVSLTFTDQ